MYNQLTFALFCYHLFRLITTINYLRYYLLAITILSWFNPTSSGVQYYCSGLYLILIYRHNSTDIFALNNLYWSR